MNSFYFNNTPVETEVMTAQRTLEMQTLEQLTQACQKIEHYLNSSPGEHQCFVTREAIADAVEGSPIFSMAKSLTQDPYLIKNNVNKIVKPVLISLKSFIDTYWNSNNLNDCEDFKESVGKLYQLVNCAYWCISEQRA